jgi:hypothetical protein
VHEPHLIFSERRGLMLSGRKLSPRFAAPSSEKYRALRCDPILCNGYIEQRSLGISKGRWRQGIPTRFGAPESTGEILRKIPGACDVYVCSATLFLFQSPCRASVAVDRITFPTERPPGAPTALVAIRRRAYFSGEVRSDTAAQNDSIAKMVRVG